MSGAQTPVSSYLTYDNTQNGIIGKGGYGFVFHGTYFGREVAVKRIEIFKVNLREETNLRKLNHENVIQLIRQVENEDFRFLVFELCATDLHNFLEGKYKGPPIKLPPDEQVLLQLTKGLNHIHSLDVIHRDIKPKNILISKTVPVMMKWADFGFSKQTNSRGSASQSGYRGTQCWMAPEILPLRNNQYTRNSKQSDIFSAGCVFFYFLKRKVHPFGKKNSAEKNISLGKMVNAGLVASDPVFQVVIIPMIAHKKEDRISLIKVIEFLEDRDQINNVFTVIKEKLAVSKLSKISEKMISISTLLQQERKDGWTIKAVKAQVIDKSSLLYMESAIPGVPATKCFFVVLTDGSGAIRARAWTAKNCSKFYPKFQVGKSYIILQSTLATSDGLRIISLRDKTEIISISNLDLS